MEGAVLLCQMEYYLMLQKCIIIQENILLKTLNYTRLLKLAKETSLNTGVDTAVLFFENTGNPTKNVEFVN